MTTGSNGSSRRAVLLGTGLAAGAAIAGCSTKAVPYDANQDGSAPGGSPTGGTGSGGTGSAGAAMPTAQGQAVSTTSTRKGTVLGPAREIPVGGGVVFAADKVVVTHPKGGKIRAFSAICTHVGCTVNQVQNGTIDCPCHGSQFNITDGSVVAGPAPSPLARRKVKVVKGKVVLL